MKGVTDGEIKALLIVVLLMRLTAYSLSYHWFGWRLMVIIFLIELATRAELLVGR